MDDFDVVNPQQLDTLERAAAVIVDPRARHRRAVSVNRVGRAHRVLRVLSAALFLACGAGLALHFAYGVSVSTILSGSMRPAFAPGDMVITRVEPVSAIHRETVILYTAPGAGAPIAHRIVAISGNPAMPVVTTRGDANPATDPPMTLRSGQVPVVIGVIPRLGTILGAVDPRRPGVRALDIVVIGLAVTFSAVRYAARRQCLCPSCQRRAIARPATRT